MSKMTREEAIERFASKIQGLKSSGNSLYNNSLPQNTNSESVAGALARLYTNLPMDGSEQDSEMLQTLFPNAYKFRPQLDEESKYGHPSDPDTKVRLDSEKMRDFVDASFTDMYALLEEKDSSDKSLIKKQLLPNELIQGYEKLDGKNIEDNLISGLMMPVFNGFKAAFCPELEQSNVETAMEQSAFNSSVARSS